MAVTSAFRFARIWRKVHEPAWGRLVTHDIPFADGVSGELHLTLRARSRILLGGARRKAGNTPGEVFPFRLPDGPWAIPASTLQGMCRAILEVAGFGRLGPWVADTAFAYRDLGTSEAAQRHYIRRLSKKVGADVTPLSLPGWLIRTSKGPVIVPCEMARIHVNEIVRWKVTKGTADTGALANRGDALARSTWVDGGNRATLEQTFTLQPPPANGWSHQNGDIRIKYDRATFGPGVDGTLVITGKPSPGLGAGRKKWDFVFHTPNRAATTAADPAAIAIDPRTWNAFALSHLAQPGRPENPNWTLWRDEFAAGRAVPVFYWKEGGRITTFGTAFAPKAAFENTPHDLLRNSHPDHAPDKVTALDLAHLIFGAAADEPGLGLKRRAAFRLARSVTPVGGPRVQTTPLGPMNLLSPKPSYFPIYVRNEGASGQVGPTEVVASYSPTAGGRHLTHPELAGVKLWPATQEAEAPGFDPLQGVELLGTPATQVRLNTLPKDTEFRTTLVFHNLRPVELGALLWALSFGDDAAFGPEVNAVRRRHRLGMGKSVHLGSVSIRIALAVDDGDSRSGPDFVKLFTDYMSDPGVIGPTWATSRQIQALLKASDPTQNRRSDLRHMPLGQNVPRDAAGFYIGERNRGGYLTDYVSGDELERPAAAPPTPAAAPRGPTPAQPVAAPPAPSLPLVVGARVLVNHPRLGRKEATVLEIRDEFNPRCLLRFDNKLEQEFRAGALTVIAGPAP